jgi:voltage-gated potassium channel
MTALRMVCSHAAWGAGGTRATVLMQQEQGSMNVHVHPRHRSVPRPAALQRRLRALYFGKSARSLRFRLAWIILDVVIIAFFILAPAFRETSVFLAADYVIAAIVAADLAARGFAWGNVRSYLRRPHTLVDVVVLASLLLPQWLLNLGFLRVLRLWTLFNSDLFWRTVGRRPGDARAQAVIRAAATLVTFLFVATGFVYTSFAMVHPDIGSYTDALYFTVATLTTTGFGDITLPGTWGKLLSIVIMIGGITGFARVGQAIFRPSKVHFRCPTCGLGTHDPDAIHCKACGTLIKIPYDEV